MSLSTDSKTDETIWRRGWDSNPRARFWQARRFRGAPVMTTSVPLRENYALESRAIESLKSSWRWLNDSAAQRLNARLDGAMAHFSVPPVDGGRILSE